MREEEGRAIAYRYHETTTKESRADGLFAVKCPILSNVSWSKAVRSEAKPLGGLASHHDVRE